MIVAVVSSALAFSRGVRPTTQPLLSAPALAVDEPFAVPLLPRHAPAQLYLADDPTGYAFMLPVATAVATSCQLCGIGGAALFSPIFLLAFPLLGPEYPLDSPAAAIASALLTEALTMLTALTALTALTTHLPPHPTASHRIPPHPTTRSSASPPASPATRAEA